MVTGQVPNTRGDALNIKYWKGGAGVVGVG